MECAEIPVGQSVDSEKKDLLDALARAYEEMHLLQGLAAVLADEKDHRMIFLKTVECLKELVPVEDAEVWIPSQEDEGFERILQCADGNVSSRPAEMPADSTVREEIVGMGVRVLREKHQEGVALDHFLAGIAEALGFPTVAVPLLSKSKLIGLLLVRIPATLQGLDSSQLGHVVAIGRQTSLSIHLHLLVEELRANERLQREIEIAREIQNSLLPQTTPKSPCYDLHAGCITAARVGGDYYDFFQDEVGRLGVLIADVAGHSVASALIAMSFRTSFRLFLEQKLELCTLFEKTNTALYKELCQSGSFLSAFYGILDETSRTFRYVNGGHNPPLHWSSKAGVFNELDEAGILIGVLPDEKYSAGEVAVGAGDVLLFYTDGIVEAENQHGEFFGMERLQQAVSKNATKSSRQVYHSVLKEMYLFQDEEVNKDDVTLIILEIKER